MPVKTGRPQLRALRTEAGWTQQQLADKLNHFAWTHGQGRAAINAGMVAKWEPGGPGGSHPRAPTERNVTVSRHSALLI